LNRIRKLKLKKQSTALIIEQDMETEAKKVKHLAENTKHCFVFLF